MFQHTAAAQTCLEGPSSPASAMSLQHPPATLHGHLFAAPGVQLLLQIGIGRLQGGQERLQAAQQPAGRHWLDGRLVPRAAR